MMCLRFVVFTLIASVGCQPNEEPRTAPLKFEHPAADTTQTLPEARKSFTPKFSSMKANEPVATPPKKTFRVVQYPSPAGKLAAYLTPDPGDGKKRPAIIWITGGDCNTIGDVWSPTKPDNDQSARQYREAGIVMMFPSLRGGNQNPGVIEGFYGEVDDVLAALDFLAKQPFVDPKRIYLGGHSTGGTLVMLVAESSDRFRAVFSFGPADDVSGYPPAFTPFDRSNRQGVALRSPGKWLHSIQSPTFVFEGEDGNIGSLEAMAKACKNPKAHFYPLAGANHFNILAPMNTLIAKKILVDDEPALSIAFTEAELKRALEKK